MNIEEQQEQVQKQEFKKKQQWISDINLFFNLGFLVSVIKN
jgi:hypothetical protein